MGTATNSNKLSVNKIPKGNRFVLISLVATNIATLTLCGLIYFTTKVRNDFLEREVKVCLGRNLELQKEEEIQKLTMGRVFKYALYNGNSLGKQDRATKFLILVTASESLLSNHFGRIFRDICALRKARHLSSDLEVGVICPSDEEHDIQNVIQTIPEHHLDVIAFWRQKKILWSLNIIMIVPCYSSTRTTYVSIPTCLNPGLC